MSSSPYEIPGNPDHFEYFKDLCYKGMVKRYGENYPQAYMDRLNYELGVTKFSELMRLLYNEAKKG